MSQDDDSAHAGRRPPRLVLISGPEQVIAERGLAQTIADLRVHAPDLEVARIEATGYTPGALAIEASPSLFGGKRAIVVNDLDEADDDLILDLMPLIEDPNPDPDLVVIVRHKSGQRGKRVLDALKKARAHVIEAASIKNDRDKHSFAMHEFRAARRKATPQAVQALIEAVGSDVRELAAACQQLIDDTTGVIDEGVVLTYHGGKVEATGFKVADAALAGDTGEALRLLRHAMAVGVSPVPMVAVIAMKIRQMIRVGAAERGPSGQVAKQLGMAPFQVDLARRALQGWDGDRLGRCLQETAAADFAVKGGVAAGGNRSVHARDPEYVIERLILTIGELHRAEPARR